MENSAIACAKKYGFRARTLGDHVIIFAKNTDGYWVTWIKCNVKYNRVAIMGNTDNLNLWFGITRNDMTPEKCLAFVTDLNEVMSLHGEDRVLVSELIDPEDWQDISGLPDAYKDNRYTGTT